MKYFLLLFPALLFSCGIAPKKEKNNAYFNVEAYFQQEISRLDDLSPWVRKKITLQDSSKILTSDSTEWSAALSLFKNASINRSSWIGLFRVDTIETGFNKRVTYQALRSDIPIKQIKITFDDQWELIDIFIQKRTNNFLQRTNQVLYYLPNEKIHIQSSSKFRLMDEERVQITITFL